MYILAICFCFGGCTTSPQEERCISTTQRMSSERWDCLAAARKSDEQKVQNQRDSAIRRSLDRKCVGFGFEPSTTAFSNCLMQLDLQLRSALAAKKSREELVERCELARLQAFAAPSRSGGAGEALQNANDAFERCMAGLPPAKSLNIICTRQEKDRVYCFSQ
jgi:hypothetical protein